jgi:hypothetical protein
LPTKMRPSTVKHAVRIKCREWNESWINNLAVASA